VGIGRFRPVLRALVVGVLAYGAAAPWLAVVHEVVVLAIARTTSWLAWVALHWDALRSLPLDPIYTGAMLSTLGGIEPRGLALAGPIGQALYEWWPTTFDPPALVAHGSWASAIIAPGATLVSRWVCGVGADAVLVAIGLVAVRFARRGSPWLAVLGAIVQAQVAATHLIDLPPELHDVEAAGVPFAIAMVTSGDVRGGPRVSQALAALPEHVRDVTLGLGLVALAYVPAIAAVLAYLIVRTVVRARARPPRWFRMRPPRRSGYSAPPSRRASLAGLAALPSRVVRLAGLVTVGLIVAISPVGDLTDAKTRFLDAPDSDDYVAEWQLDSAAGVLASPVVSGPGGGIVGVEPGPPNSPTVQREPSVVSVTGSGYRFQYAVNGSPRIIRGIGYNVRYRHLGESERVGRLDRDFAKLRDAGVTTVFGWEPSEFDQTLLDAAQRHGLGVAPPFELDPYADYSDPFICDRITRDTLAWVRKYRDHPAIRMWAIGNEVLHKLVYPSWMPIRSDPAWEERARAFARFYVKLIDQVHAVDPLHPVINRDAEDAYLTWLRDEMGGGERRRWFIYGVNSYTPRLSEIVARWPRHGWDVPLLVSEFAPGGMSPADRPSGFRSMWKMIRGANGWVIGGAVYAWTTDGPEEVDRVFGLVDAEGNPVDGSFAAIRDLYRGSAPRLAKERVASGPAADPRIWLFARQAIAAIQRGESRSLLPLTADTAIMGDVDAISALPVAEADLSVQRVLDDRRVAWGREEGVIAEWWVSWLAPDRPTKKLAFVVQERRDGVLGVHYIYHGPR
jgi:hypothetical protein